MNRKGFTLIELLLVIAIILTIAALMSPVLISIRKKALIVSCQSNMRQTNAFIEIYSSQNDGYIPRTSQDVEARNHPQKLRDPGTRIPSLKGLVTSISGNNPSSVKVTRCPADTGSYGQDYFPTAQGVPCWDAFGQSQQVNQDMYLRGGPGFDPQYQGDLFGAKGITRSDPQNYKRDPTKYMILADMWAHWHNEIAINGNTKGYYVNVLFLDGHVAGQAFDTSLEAQRFLNMRGVKRWWEPPEE